MFRASAIAVIIVLASASAVATESLKDIDWILGTWRGTTSGDPGEGMIERVCQYVLAGRYIECRSTSMYPVQEKNKKGEVHTEIGIISFDKRAKKLRLRLFTVEGFVNTSIEEEPLVFVTETIENIPPGWRAREAWRRTDDDSLEETFSLAPPEKDFRIYSRSVMKKVK